MHTVTSTTSFQACPSRLTYAPRYLVVTGHTNCERTDAASRGRVNEQIWLFSTGLPPMSKAEKAQQDADLAFLSSFGGDVLQHESELAERGIYIVSDTTEIAPVATTNDMVNVRTPYVYCNTQQARYFVVAKFNWKASADYEYFDAPCNSADAPCNVGGDDGFGMRFNRNVTNLGVSSIFCGRTDPDRTWATFDCTWPSNPAENSSAGVTYIKQDKVYKTVVKPDFNMYRGNVSMAFSGVPCGTTFQVYGRYLHSWNSTTLTGFGVSTNGFSISWAGGGSSWPASSPGMVWQRC